MSVSCVCVSKRLCASVSRLCPTVRSSLSKQLIVALHCHMAANLSSVNGRMKRENN